ISMSFRQMASQSSRSSAVASLISLATARSSSDHWRGVRLIVSYLVSYIKSMVSSNHWKMSDLSSTSLRLISSAIHIGSFRFRSYTHIITQRETFVNTGGLNCPPPALLEDPPAHDGQHSPGRLPGWPAYTCRAAVRFRPGAGAPPGGLFVPRW